MMAATRLTPGRRLGAEGALYLLAGMILIGGLTAAGVIVGTASSTTATTRTPASTSTTTSSSASTCAGWATVKSSMEGMTKMPDGWTYDTPLIDITIQGRAAQLDKIVPLFVNEITPEPFDLAARAHAWVAAQSVEGPKLRAHTFTPADRAAIDAAAHSIDVACGMS